MNASYRWAVVTDDRCKARETLSKVFFSRDPWIVRSWGCESRIFIEWKDGIQFEWYRPSELQTGRRFCRLWLDKSISDTEKDAILKDCHAGDEDDIVWI